MATAYSEIYGYVRSLIGDDNSEAYLYTDGVLLSQLNFLIIELDDPLITVGSSSHFATVLTNNQLATFAVKMALNILSPESDNFRYTAPMLSVARSGGISALVTFLKAKLDVLEGNDNATATDDFISALLAGPRRYFDTIQAGLSAI